MRVIYKTTNLINGKIYIGKDSRNRKDYFGSGSLLNRAIKKYEIVNFKKDIIEICFSLEELNIREIYWIKYYDSTNKQIGYNILPGGEGGDTFTNSPNKENTRINLRNSSAIRFTNETEDEKNIRINKLKGKKRTKETKDKISKGNSNKKRTKEMTDKISKSIKIYFNSEKGKQQRLDQSKRMKERVRTKSTAEKQSATMKLKKIKPKKLEIHPSSEYWFFYNKDNELILKTIGNFISSLKQLKTNMRRIIKFDSVKKCLEHKLEDKYQFKVFHEKYYKK